MPRRTGVWNLTLVGMCLVAATVALARPLDPLRPGYEPLLVLWGGDAAHAAREVARVTGAVEALLLRPAIDATTQAVIDEAFEELEDFQLQDFYALLPDAHAGGREMNVSGRLDGAHYRITHRSPVDRRAVTLQGPRRKLGDMSLRVHGRLGRHADRDTVIAGGAFGLGLGPLDYPSLVAAQRSLLDVLSTAVPESRVPRGHARATSILRDHNPQLGEEDLVGLARLLRAYPTVFRELMQLGVIEDVRSKGMNGGIVHLTLAARMDPKRIARRYPELAAHVERLSHVLQAAARVVDAGGRTLLRLRVDSGSHRLSLECYTRDGMLLPFRGERVFSDAPFDPLSPVPAQLDVWVAARVDILGIRVRVRGLRLRTRYQAHARHVAVTGRITDVPRFDIEGRALGVLPPGLLDAFIPGTMAQIAEDFMRIAAEGNDGRGIALDLRLGAAKRGDPGVLEVDGGVELVDSFFVRLGGSMLTERLLLDAQAEAEAEQLSVRLLDAMRRDSQALARAATRASAP